MSRGESVEIGGAFRVPEVLEQSGARLIDVGTTNRTRLTDYQRAIVRPGNDVAVVLKVHPSNYRLDGFVESTSVTELAALGVPVVVDLGSGLLDARVPWLTGPPPAWLAGEPAALQTLADGAVARDVQRRQAARRATGRHHRRPRRARRAVRRPSTRPRPALRRPRAGGAAADGAVVPPSHGHHRHRLLADGRSAARRAQAEGGADRVGRRRRRGGRHRVAARRRVRPGRHHPVRRSRDRRRPSRRAAGATTRRSSGAPATGGRCLDLRSVDPHDDDVLVAALSALAR